MTLLIRSSGDSSWREPAGRGYDNEVALQTILVEHPDLVPGVDGSAIACREFSSGVGPADVVVLDAEGSITVVECKLSANAEVRRTVVGQVLDYASRLWQMDIADFERRWQGASSGRNPFDLLSDDPSRLREAVAQNLAAARFNLVLAVDAINDDLRRIVEYLNAITRPETGIMLVEFTRYHEGDQEILIPRSFGSELVAAKADAADARRRRWTESDFAHWCSDNSPAVLPVVDALLSELHVCEFGITGGRAATPSLNVAFRARDGRSVAILCLHTYPARGPQVEVRFPAVDQPEHAERFAVAVCAIEGVTITVEELRDRAFQRRPEMPLEGFTPGSARALVRTIAAELTSFVDR